MMMRSVVLTCITMAISIAALPISVHCGGSDLEFVMGKAQYAESKASMPPKGVAVPDPVFYTPLVRITDKADGYSGPGMENEYARTDPENSDGTYVILRGNGGEWYLYDARTFLLKKHLAAIVGGGEEPEPRWDAANPRIFYYLYGTELRSYNIDTDLSAVVHDFKSDFRSAAYISTKTEGDASLDRRYWCFMVEDASFKVIAVAAFDKNTNRVIGKKTGFPDVINWVSMDMSGDHCIVGYESRIAQVFPRDFSTVRDLPERANGHMDLALTADKRDVMVYQNNATDWIAMADLDTGKETPLIEIPFNINGDIGLHFSGNCSQTPGWVLVSTYGAKDAPPGQTHSWMDNQLFMVELKANPRIWRIAHTHSYTSRTFTGEKNYFAECFAAINTGGTKIYFGSNGDDFSSEYSDTYQAILPERWVTAMPGQKK